MAITYSGNISYAKPDIGEMDWGEWEHRNKEIADAIAHSILAKSCVFDGCEVTLDTGLDVDIAAGRVRVGANNFTFSATSTTLTGAGTGEDVKTSYLHINSTGGLVVTTNNTASGDVLPLAVVDCDDTSILRIIDIRPIEVSPVIITAHYLTGNIIGGGIASTTTTSVTMRAFSCMDHKGTTHLYKDTTTTLTIDAGDLVADTDIHVFMIKKSDGSFSYGYDTDIDGANLSTDFSATHWRWDSYFRINGDAEVPVMYQIEDELFFLSPNSSSWKSAEITSTTYVDLAADDIPKERVRYMWCQTYFNASCTTLRISADSGSTTFHWDNDSGAAMIPQNVVIPPLSTVYGYVGAGTAQLRSVKWKLVR